MSKIWAPSDILMHHGIKGQRWGVRRFQNPDGSLTNAGKNRYGTTFSEKKNLRREKVNKVKEARKTYDDERKKLHDLEKRKDDIEADTTFNNDKVSNLFFEAKSYWNDEEDRPTTDEEDDARWKKYKDEYDKALSHNKEYKKVLNEIEKQEIKVKDLEELAKTKIGEDYAPAVASMASTITVMALLSYLASKGRI